MKISILEPGAWGTILGILLNKRNNIGFWYEDKKLALKIVRLRKTRNAEVRPLQIIRLYLELPRALKKKL